MARDPATISVRPRPALTLASELTGLARRRRDSTLPTEVVASLRLAGRERGAGPALVLVHGLASSSRYWGDLAPLAQQYRVIAPDLLGFGRSPRPPDSAYGPDEHLAALSATLTPRLSEPFTLVGHSLGSLLALQYAGRYPEQVRALVLISLPLVGDCAWGHGIGGVMNPWHRFSVHSRAGHALFGTGMRAAHPLWRRVGPRLRRDAPAAAVQDALAGSWTAYWRSLEAVVYGTDAPALLARLRAPLTMIHGAGDTVAPLQPVLEIARGRPNTTFRVIAEAGHNPYFSHHAEVVALIEQAMDS